MQGYGACATHACAMQGTLHHDMPTGFHLLASFSRLLAVACWLPHLSSLSVLSLACWLSPASIRLPPADLRLLASCSLWLACLFSLACWLSPAGIRLPHVDFRLLASCSRLLAVACWVPPPAGSLSHAGCRLLASIFHLLAFTFCFFDSSDFTGGPVTRTSTHDTALVGLLTNTQSTKS